MKVYQRITRRLQDFTDVSIDKLVSSFFWFSKSDKVVLGSLWYKQIFSFNLADEVFEVLMSFKGIGNLHLFAHKEFKGYWTWLIGVRSSKTNRDFQSKYILNFGKFVNHQRWDKALSVEHLHFKKTIVAVLSSACVKVELSHGYRPRERGYYNMLTQSQCFFFHLQDQRRQTAL